MDTTVWGMWALCGGFFRDMRQILIFELEAALLYKLCLRPVQCRNRLGMIAKHKDHNSFSNVGCNAKAKAGSAAALGLGFTTKLS